MSVSHHVGLANYCFFVIAADIISTVEFDSTGNYLATGDKGGRVVLFERNEMVSRDMFALISYPATCHRLSGRFVLLIMLLSV